MVEKITRLLPKTQWIRVDKRDGGPRSSPKWSEINRITPERSASGEVTDGPIEIAYFMIWCAQNYLEEHVDDATDVFRGLFYVEEDGVPKPKPVQFTVMRDGEDMVRRPFDDEYEPLNQNIVMSSFSQLVNHFQGFITTILSHSARLEGALLEIHRSSQSQQTSMQTVVEKMSAVYHTGLTMQQQSMQSILEVEKNIKQQELEAKRGDRLMSFLEKSAPQMFDIAKFKLGIRTTEPKQKPNEKKPADAKPAQEADAAASSGNKNAADASAPAANAEAKPERTFPLAGYKFEFLTVAQLEELAALNKKSHAEVPYYHDPKEPEMTDQDSTDQPFVAIIISLRKSLTLEQGKKLKDDLPEDVYQTLDHALRSTEFVDALDRVHELKKKIEGRTELYGTFMSVLNPEQLTWVMALIKFVQGAIEQGAIKSDD